jgi:ribonuclease P protein component
MESMSSADFARRGASSRAARATVRVVRFDDDTVKVGWVTPKKLGSAVRRNRLRRRGRAIAAELADAGALRPGRYVVTFTAAAIDAPFDVLRADLRSTLVQLSRRRR